MTIKEGNDLIAKFCSFPEAAFDDDLGQFYYIDDVEINKMFSLVCATHVVTAEEIPFNSSWNHLMPAVNKCLRQHPEMDEHSKLFQNINNALMACDIEDVRQAVIDFIIESNKTIK